MVTGGKRTGAVIRVSGGLEMALDLICLVTVKIQL